MDSNSCFDPVTQLPGDVAAVCLSFADVRSLLVTARLVNRAWRDAIDGGLPSVWHEVRLCLPGELPDEEPLTADQIERVLAAVAQRSHGQTHTLNVHENLSTQALQHILPLTRLRVLRIENPLKGCSLGTALPALTSLETLCVRVASNPWSSKHVSIDLPPLHFLKTVELVCFESVKGIHNLSALTKLELRHCSLDADDTWPASLREVTIFDHTTRTPQVLDRIAAYHQLFQLRTDWSFLKGTEHDPSPLFFSPFDQLSFLPLITSLQHLTLNLAYDHYPPHTAVFNSLGDIRSLCELSLERMRANDEELQCVTQLTNLHSLSLIYVEGLTSQSLTLLSLLPKLTKLCIGGCKSITDYSPIGLCSKLQALEISGSSLKLTAAEVQAVSQLEHIHKLTLQAALDDPSSFSLICNMSCLRDLEVWDCTAAHHIPATAFSSLPSLSRLERFAVSPTEPGSMSALVDCLVKMPMLKDIRVREWPTEEQEARLRDALPRLESIRGFSAIRSSPGSNMFRMDSRNYASTKQMMADLQQCLRNARPW